MIKYTDKYIDPSDLIKEQCTDAQLWAKSFIDQINRGYFKKTDIDEGLMIAWFANAIVIAEDKEYRKKKDIV